MLVTRFNKKFLQAKIFSFKRLGQVQRTLTHSRSSVGPLAPPTCGAEVALPSDAKPIASGALFRPRRFAIALCAIPAHLFTPLPGDEGPPPPRYVATARSSQDARLPEDVAWHKTRSLFTRSLSR